MAPWVSFGIGFPLAYAIVQATDGWPWFATGLIFAGAILLFGLLAWVSGRTDDFVPYPLFAIALFGSFAVFKGLPDEGWIITLAPYLGFAPLFAVLGLLFMLHRGRTSHS